MARRPPQSPTPLRPFRDAAQKRIDIERLGRRIRDLEAFDPSKVQKRWPPEVEALQTSIEETLSTVFGHGTVEYKRYQQAAALDNGPIVMSMGHRDDARDAYEARQYLAEGKTQSIVMLTQAIRFLEEEITDAELSGAASAVAETSEKASRKVFVVHGHDHGAKDAVARFLDKLELKAIILQEQPDRGMTIIEKFEAYANEVGFAVVLLTPDDIGGAILADAPTSRARQNVIFELGYFVGKLGRGKACLMRKGDVEIPSDLYGVIYTNIDAAEGWKLKLVKELKAAGLPFDANKAWE